MGVLPLGSGKPAIAHGPGYRRRRGGSGPSSPPEEAGLPSPGSAAAPSRFPPPAGRRALHRLSARRAAGYHSGGHRDRDEMDGVARTELQPHRAQIGFYGARRDTALRSGLLGRQAASEEFDNLEFPACQNRDALRHVDSCSRARAALLTRRQVADFKKVSWATPNACFPPPSSRSIEGPVLIWNILVR